jgi:DNA-binding PadR family transcriptional regulator
MPFPRLRQSILDDYGYVCTRTIYRHIAKLVKYGLLERIEFKKDEAYYCLSKTGEYYLRRIIYEQPISRIGQNTRQYRKVWISNNLDVQSDKRDFS